MADLTVSFWLGSQWVWNEEDFPVIPCVGSKVWIPDGTYARSKFLRMPTSAFIVESVEISYRTKEVVVSVRRDDDQG